jgi:hypothetical protein
MERAQEMYAEARLVAEQAGEEVIMVDWAGALLAAHAGDWERAIPQFERILANSRERGDRWSEYECLREWVLLELEAPVLVSSDHTDELRAVAAKMSDGSEGAAADALDSLIRLRRGDESAARNLENAIESLRVVDAKGMLAYTLTLAAERDFDLGRLDRAEKRAAEALRAAEAVNRKSLMALARLVLARVALAHGNVDDARRFCAATEADYRNFHTLSARARTAYERFRTELQIPESSSLS